MSLHRSLKTKSAALDAHRNVLTRVERIATLQEQGRFSPDSDSPLGLPKVRNIKVMTGKKKKAAKEEETEAEATETAGD